MSDKDIKEQGKNDYLLWRQQFDLVNKLKQERRDKALQWTAKVEEGYQAERCIDRHTHYNRTNKPRALPP